jgi:Protein of unknown function (DUF1501)
MAMRRNCNGVTRRDCLQLGLGGFIAGGLVGALRATAMASDAALPRRAKGCILIWMDGGPSHYETFDPKPEAPLEVRGQFDSIKTAIPGVHYAEHMNRLAAIADKTAIIRSICHNQGNHGAGNHYMMTGMPPRIPVGCGAFVSFHPSMGSVVAEEVGAPHGMPAYFSMPSMSRSGGPNFLGAKYAPFVVSDNPNSDSFRVRDVALPQGLTAERFLDRQAIRKQVDHLKRISDETAGDPVVALDSFYEQGHQIITSAEAQAAFDIHAEPKATRDKYGRDGFGQRALLARRLVEAGVPFVTLYEGGWDHHTDIFDSLGKRLPAFDNTVAALIDDLHERGMLDEVMVVALGEFGRTPKVNERGGRDHWSNAMSVLFAGGHTPGGQAVGATDRQGYAAIQNVLHPENFVSTIYAKLGINPGKILYSPEGRPIPLVSVPEPIRELMG